MKLLTACCVLLALMCLSACGHVPPDFGQSINETETESHIPAYTATESSTQIHDESTSGEHAIGNLSSDEETYGELTSDVETYVELASDVETFGELASDVEAFGEQASDVEAFAEQASGVDTIETISESILKQEFITEAEMSLYQQFFVDANVPEVARETFAMAIRGDAEAQKWVYSYKKEHSDLEWSFLYSIFPSGNNDDPYTEAECLYNIGMFYYKGIDYIGFAQNKKNAFDWIVLSASKGSACGAVMAGDMLRYGDGVPVDEIGAFNLYSQAVGIKPEGAASQRMGDCYAEGIGVAVDERAAFRHYLDSAMMDYVPGLYKLSETISGVVGADGMYGIGGADGTSGLGGAVYSDVNLDTLYKATSSQDYSSDYWGMVYGGLDAYTASIQKRNLVDNILASWSMQNQPVRSNEYFPQTFVEALIKAAYSYSYHVFAEDHGIRPNRTHADAGRYQFFSSDDKNTLVYDDGVGEVERYLKNEENRFFEYDFDGDGIDEIGFPLLSGAGGALMADRFGIYKKNVDGLYEYFSYGPDCTLRDAMRIILFNGKIYFIINPFDDMNNNPYNIDAYTFDSGGVMHEMSIICEDYLLRHVITYTDDDYSYGYDELLSDIHDQMQEAVAATKQGTVYCTDREKQNQIHLQIDSDLWRTVWGGITNTAPREEVFISADIDNNGSEDMIHKGRVIFEWKYLDDYNCFQIYQNHGGLNKDASTIQEPKFSDDFYGLHSAGNIYEVLPVSDNVTQFWTHEFRGAIYCVTLQKYELLYALQIFFVQNDEVHLVSKGLYFDEAQNYNVVFS